MNIDERNTWLVSNIEHITRLLRDFCDRYKEVEFEELYLEMIEKIIEFVDTHELVDPGYFRSDKGTTTYIWQWILNQSMRIRNKKKNVEEPHYCFELLYLEDLDIPFISEYIYKTAVEVLNPWELASFLLKAEWDCTFSEIAETIGVGKKQARDFYQRACRKLYATRSLRNQLKDYRDLYFYGGF